MLKNLILKFAKRPPVIFPLLALFLLVMVYVESVTWLGSTDVYKIYWLRPIIMFVYFILWCGTTMFNRWFATGFIILSLANVAFQVFGPDVQLKNIVGDLLFEPLPVNLLMAFIALFYYRRMHT